MRTEDKKQKSKAHKKRFAFLLKMPVKNPLSNSTSNESKAGRETVSALLSNKKMAVKKSVQSGNNLQGYKPCKNGRKKSFFHSGGKH